MWLKTSNIVLYEIEVDRRIASASSNQSIQSNLLQISQSLWLIVVMVCWLNIMLAIYLWISVNVLQIVSVNDIFGVACVVCSGHERHLCMCSSRETVEFMSNGRSTFGGLMLCSLVVLMQYNCKQQIIIVWRYEWHTIMIYPTHITSIGCYPKSFICN